MAFIHWLSGVGDFPARWHCGTWTPLHGYTHIISDLLIGLSYLAIAGILIATVLRSPKLPLRGFFRFFAAFILACGLTHIVEASIFYLPVYRVSAFMKVLTALVSVGTALSLSPLGLFSRLPELAGLNRRLARELEQTRLSAIEDRTRVEARLALLGRALDARPLIFDRNGGFSQPTPSWERLSGQTWPAYQGDGWRAAIHHGDALEVGFQLDAALSSRQPTDISLRLWRDQEGVFRSYRFRMEPMLNENGELLEWVGCVTDETRAKANLGRLQQQNRELRRELGNMVAIRSDLESFTTTVSHDLRAPLRHMKAAFEPIEAEAEALTGPAREALREVTGEARRMNSMIDDLLRFARLGIQPLEPEPLPLSELVDSAGRRVERGTRRPLHVVCERHSIIHADPALLRHVFDNLFENAVKYTPSDREPVITVRCEARPHEWTIQISDEGIGINEATADQLFGAFRRMNQDPDIPGNGIGLAICRRVVERHGGRIWATGRPGEGSTFHFTLPNPEASPIARAIPEPA